MKIIIAGSRGITDYEVVEAAVAESGFAATVVVSGGADGVDALGERWALEHGLHVVRFPARWKYYGRRAGVIRNLEMVRFADALVAVWDGQSKGTGHTIREARKRGLLVHVKSVPSSPSLEGQATGARKRRSTTRSEGKVVG